MEVLYYEIPKLFNRVKIESLYFVNTAMLGKEGAQDAGELSITGDDEAFVRALLKTGALNVFAKLSPYSRNIPGGGFSFEAVVNEGLANEVKDCVVFRCEFPKGFDSSVIPVLDEEVRNAMVNYALSEYFGRNGFGNEAQKSLFEENMDAILSLINRRTNLRINYKIY